MNIDCTVPKLGKQTMANKFLMPLLFAVHGYSGNEVLVLNQCWCYLQAITTTDISQWPMAIGFVKLLRRAWEKSPEAHPMNGPKGNDQSNATGIYGGRHSLMFWDYQRHVQHSIKLWGKGFKRLGHYGYGGTIQQVKNFSVKKEGYEQYGGQMVVQDYAALLGPF
jgi:hypothetical protein